jgi:hypothetical protein
MKVWTALLPLVLLAGLLAQSPAPAGESSPSSQRSFELTTSVAIDVDGAPNAYGPKGNATLDFELNAHEGGTSEGAIVGYMTKTDKRTPELQGPRDPFPGYYISTTGFEDPRNPNNLDPHKYVDASKINYVVLGSFARRNGARLGDFAAVYSKKTGRSVFAIIGDSGNASGAEGSLALLQALGYAFKTGKTGGVEKKDIIIRYYPGSNPQHHFFASQESLDAEAAQLGLNRHFSGQQ